MFIPGVRKVISFSLISVKAWLLREGIDLADLCVIFDVLLM
jgi:hypothetical protein